MHSLSPRSETPTPEPNPANSFIAGKVRRALQQLPPHRWKAGEIARHLSISRDHLSRQLKGDSGITLSQVIADHRLRQTQTALLTQDCEIQEIAEQVGILDRNYFARWFRTQTGLTPSQWRARHR